jgi:hypothetical protein
MQNDFGVGARVEDSPELLEFSTQLNVIENLAVECDAQRARVNRHRLRARREIHDGETPMRESNTLMNRHARIIRAAVCKHFCHAQKQIRSRRCFGVAGDDSCDSTHVLHQSRRTFDTSFCHSCLCKRAPQ